MPAPEETRARVKILTDALGIKIESGTLRVIQEEKEEEFITLLMLMFPNLYREGDGDTKLLVKHKASTAFWVLIHKADGGLYFDEGMLVQMENAKAWEANHK